MREQTNQKCDSSVLIAGAGPTGLVLALWLKKKNIPFRIIDKNLEPGKTSRALAVQTRTLEFYQQLGIAEKLIEAGIVTQDLIMRRHGQVVARAKLGEIGEDNTPYPYLLFCSQDVHEELLCDLLKKEGVEIERGVELLDIEQNEQNVQCTVQTAKGKETIVSDYLCGCDGAHSVVRHQMPTKFEGGTYSQIFFVADVLATGAMAEKDVQVSVDNEGFCIVLPIKKKGSVRLVGIVPTASEKKVEINYDDVAESVAKNTGLKVGAVNWFSVYRVHHRMAQEFQKNRVFLAGDAGHIHSPAGGQGMNTGIGDAVNLAWKLAEVIQGNHSKKLLESYSIERMAFAKVLLKTTDTAFRLLADQSFTGRIFRVYILPSLFAFLTRFQFFLRFAFRTISQTKIEYHNSFLSAGQLGMIRAGDRLPWLLTNKGHNYQPLQSLSWQIHIYGDAKANLKETGLTVCYFDWSGDAQKKGFIRDAMYLIRPDGYIALVHAEQSVFVIQNYFKVL